MFTKLRAKVFNNGTGLLPQKPDHRDIEVGLLWGLFESYEPKHKWKVLDVYSAKNQYRNTCGWNSATAMHEMDEGEYLDERSLVMFGRERGYISGDGFSTLRNNQKVLQKDGVAPKGLLGDDRSSWENYSNFKLLTPEIRFEASKRRTKSYAMVGNVDEVYKAIDNDRCVQIGVDWYTGWNMSGGFKLPWLVYKAIGWLAGGHAMYIHGYDTEYEGKRVFIVRNSFGTNYGDKGDLYMTEAMLAPNIDKYGAFINYDLDVDMARWLEANQGKVVKTKDKPDVYLIEGDKKRRFTDEASLLAHGFMIEEINTVDYQYLSKVSEGEKMKFWDGTYVKPIKEIVRIAKDNNIEAVFKSYFSELLK